jgi:hypothetical protein
MILGDERILYLKLNGVFAPVGCLTDNSFEESSDTLDTTTIENNGWKTSRATNQSYSISFNGIQLNSTLAGGDFTKISYDKLKELKRTRVVLDWKIQGATFPLVDYGKCIITDLSEAAPVGELLTFSGSLQGYGQPLMASSALVLLNDGDPTRIVQDGNNNLIKVQ